MSSYLIGNLVGRLLMSAFLVWLVLLCINRFKFGYSAKRLIRPLPLLSTITLFFLGLIGHAAADTQAKQLFWVSTFPDIGIEEIYIPAEPEWLFETELHDQHKTLTLTSQAINDVPAFAQLIQHAFPVSDSNYAVVRDAVVERYENQLNTSLVAQHPKENHLSSTSFVTTTQYRSDSMFHQLDIFPANGRVWTFSSVVTAEEASRFQTTRDKIFKSIRLSAPEAFSQG